MKRILLTSLVLFSVNVFAASNSSFSFLSDEQKITGFNYNKNSKVLTITLDDDGTPRHGYAEYIAMELKDRGLAKDVDTIFCKDTYYVENNDERNLCWLKKNEKGFFDIL